jgi:plastocyanin
MKNCIRFCNSWWLAALCASLVAPLGTRGATVGVNIINFSYQPSSVDINVGDTVTWTQKDTSQHTSTSDTSLWSSPLLSVNQTFSHTFDTSGSFPYHCTVHPFMTASVSVQGTAVNQPPTVSITTPANGATLTDTNVTIQATASDPDGTIAHVEFFEGRTSLGTATSAPYQITVPLGLGTHNLTAQATDNQGATTSSSVVTITIVAPTNTPPTVSITSPSDGATFTAPASISLQANASDADGTISKVEFFAGNTSLGSATSSPFTVTWTNVAAGTYTVTARATDNLGASTVSNPVHITVNAATVAAPTLSGMTKTPDNKFHFTVQGTAGHTYLVQASSDLQNWNTIQTIPASTDTFTVTDTPPADATLRFYRVQLQQ